MYQGVEITPLLKLPTIALIELFTWVLKQKDAFVSAILFSFNLALLPVINININIRKKYLKTYIS